MNEDHQQLPKTIKSHRQRWLRMFIGVTLGLCVLTFVLKGIDDRWKQLFQRIELYTWELRFSLRPARQIRDDIALILVQHEKQDQITLQQQDEVTYALLRNQVQRIINFNPLPRFPTYSETDDFESRYPYLPLLRKQVEKIPHGLDFRNSPSPPQWAFYSQFALKQEQVKGDWKGKELFPAEQIHIPLSYDHESGHTSDEQAGGHIIAQADFDGNYRRMPLIIRSGEYYYPALSLIAACQELGVEQIEVTLGRSIVLYDQSQNIIRTIPIDNSGRMIINYPGDYVHFQLHQSVFSFESVLASSGARLGEEQPLNLKEAFPGKIVLIGSGKLERTPVEKLPLAAIHASTLDSILQNRFLHPMYGMWTVILAVLFTAAMVASQLYTLPLFRRSARQSQEGATSILSKRPALSLLWTSIAALLVFLVFGGMSVALFNLGGIIIPVTIPLFAMIVGYVVTAIYSRYVLLKGKNIELEMTNQQIKENNKELAIANQRIQEAYSTLKEAYSHITGEGAKTMKNAPEATDDIVTAFREIADELIQQHDERLLFTRQGGVIHELRRPLNYAEASINYPDIVLKNIEQAKKFLESMSQWNKVKTPKRIEMDCKPYNLKRRILREAIEVIKPKVEGKNIKVTLDCSPNYSVNVDVDLIQQVFGNLLNNAIKFTPEGGEIRIVVIDAKENYKIQIIDTGPGVAPEERDEIFKPYYFKKPKNSEKSGYSLGLGLPIAKEIVELHGGAIWVEDADSGGSKFVFTLPNFEEGENERE